jgi:hypothetical protein
VGYVGTHGSNLDQYVSYNNPPNAYVWYSSTGQPLPTGTYANTATRPFDKTTYGNVSAVSRVGWSNANCLQAEVERRYAHGAGFQVFYVMSNALRAGGSGDPAADYFLPNAAQFMPGAVPDDVNARMRLLWYGRDTDIPKHRIRWNWILDLPFGRKQKFGRNAGRLLDTLIGGWQIAGFGRANSRYWALPTSGWGALGKIEVYGTRYPIEDCRSGTCIQGYLWYNGYIPANRINSRDAQGRPNGVMGVPPDYKPAYLPVFPTPADGGSPTDPNRPYYETNTVWVPLKNGTLQRTSVDTGLHPWRNQYMPGPWNWSLDGSLFKRIAITERVAVRFNADFFNVLNMPGMPMPGSDTGIISLRNSVNAPRQLQLTLRLAW